MDSIFIQPNNIPLKSSKIPKILHKNTISYTTKLKTPHLRSNFSNELFLTGDRFIPFKNDKENFQNFLLKTPITNNNIKNNTNSVNNNELNEQNLLSPLDEKPEKNYANFIVDNMLRTNSDNYNFNNNFTQDKKNKNNKKFRSNSIFTFSKKVSFNSINFNINNNANKNYIYNSNINTSNKKEKNINNISSSKIKEKNSINNITNNSLEKSNKIKESKNKTTKINTITSLLYEPSQPEREDRQNNIFQNFLFNEENISDVTSNNSNNKTNNEMLFQYIETTSNKRNILPDVDYLLANYSTNNNIKRKINLTPERILDAPNLVDDYYLNLLEWGVSNTLAVALGPEIYLWNGDTYETSLLMSIINDENDSNSLLNNTNNIITSLSWMNNGVGIGVGLPTGVIEIWDVVKSKKIREIEAHSDRISSLAWNGYIITSGSKDKVIKNFDVRIQDSEISKIRQHKQEVCALRYSPDGELLASGGNDNACYIWDVRKLNNKLLNISNLNEVNNTSSSIKPLYCNNYHTAAVKAMSWCPWQRHILATGGGSKDRTLKIFNCDTNKVIKNVDTGSQVCAVLWNKKEREIISSHGFNKNQITIWNYQKMKKICELKGHMSRVLYLTISPDENYICSGSGDETLRFWKINDDIKEVQNEEDPLLSNVIIR